MTMRVATSDDFDVILEMAMKFIESTNYKELADQQTIANFVWNLLDLPATEGIVILTEGGMLAGVIKPFVFGTVKLATEVAWWVDPDKRSTGIGKALLDTFEYWAEANHCTGVIMVSLDDQLAKYYEKQGYKVQERTYMKELN